MVCRLEMFYLNTIEQLFLFVEQLGHLEVCLPYSRMLTGIPLLAVFKNLRWNSKKSSLVSLTTEIQHCFNNHYCGSYQPQYYTQCPQYYTHYYQYCTYYPQYST